MDERHALSLLRWTIGIIVGMLFVLNAIPLSSAQRSRGQIGSIGSRGVGPRS